MTLWPSEREEGINYGQVEGQAAQASGQQVAPGIPLSFQAHDATLILAGFLVTVFGRSLPASSEAPLRRKVGSSISPPLNFSR